MMGIKVSLAPLPVYLTWSTRQKNQNIAFMIIKIIKNSVGTAGFLTTQQVNANG